MGGVSRFSSTREIRSGPAERTETNQYEDIEARSRVPDSNFCPRWDGRRGKMRIRFSAVEGFDACFGREAPSMASSGPRMPRPWFADTFQRPRPDRARRNRRPRFARLVRPPCWRPAGTGFRAALRSATISVECGEPLRASTTERISFAACIGEIDLRLGRPVGDGPLRHRQLHPGCLRCRAARIVPHLWKSGPA